MQKYPKWKYHESEPPCIVASEADEKSLGAGWKDSPALFAKHKQSEAEKEAAVIKELEDVLIAQGVPRKRLLGKSKAELLAMIEAKIETVGEVST